MSGSSDFFTNNNENKIINDKSLMTIKVIMQIMTRVIVVIKMMTIIVATITNSNNKQR